MKKTLFGLALMASAAMPFAMADSSGQCQPTQVVAAEVVGSSRDMDFDSIKLVAAIAANTNDFAKLMEGRVIWRAKIEILPSENAGVLSPVTQYTIIAGPQTSPLAPLPPPAMVKKLILKSSYNTHIMDAAFLRWESSGVVDAF